MAKASPRLILIPILAAVALTNGCARAPKRPTPADSSGGAPVPAEPGTAPGAGTAADTPAESYGPADPEGTQQAYGPEPVQVRAVTLVLGPGLARGFAYAGALKALEEAKVPIREIIATEIGACMAVLYVMSKSANEFDWALLRLKEDVFVDRGLMRIFGKASEGRRLQRALEQLLGEKDLGEGRIPLRIGLQRLGVGDLVFLDRGLAAEAVRGAMGVPGVMDPSEVSGGLGLTLSTAGKLAYAVAEARKNPESPVVVIDVLEGAPAQAEPKLAEYISAARTSSREQLKDADLVIRPDLNGFGFMDFRRRTDAAFRGKRAVSSRLGDIRHLVGMPR